MREIKFRCWDKDTHRMYYQSNEHPCFTYGDLCHCSLEDVLHYYEDDFELMQYTGIKDNSGREIYEGDIVALVYDFGEEELHKSNLGVVTFGEFFAEIYCVVGWYVSRDGEQISESGLDNDFVVFGNIYENPELLE